MDKEIKFKSSSPRRCNYDEVLAGSGFSDPIGVFYNEDEVGPNGVIVKAVKVKQVSPVDFSSQYKVSDFSMENLVAIGAVGSLRNCQYGDINTDEFISGLDDYTDSLNNLEV